MQNPELTDVETTETTYKSEGGEVKAQIYRLKDSQSPAPAILMLPGRSRNFQGIEWLIKPLAQKGYTVMAISYRSDPIAPYLRDVEDVVNGISHLESFPNVAKSRFGLFGHSRGGAAALLSVASGDKRIRSAVCASAPSDHFKRVEETKASPANYVDRMRTRGIPPEEDPGYYRSISPIYNAHRMKDVPILIIHGARDFLILVDHALNMYGALKVAGNREARIEIIIGAGHFFERAFSGYAFDEVINLTIGWFDKTLRAKTSEM